MTRGMGPVGCGVPVLGVFHRLHQRQALLRAGNCGECGCVDGCVRLGKIPTYRLQFPAESGPCISADTPVASSSHEVGLLLRRNCDNPFALHCPLPPGRQPIVVLLSFHFLKNRPTCFASCRTCVPPGLFIYRHPRPLHASGSLPSAPCPTPRPILLDARRCLLLVAPATLAHVYLDYTRRQRRRAAATIMMGNRDVLNPDSLVKYNMAVAGQYVIASSRARAQRRRVGLHC